MQNVRTLPLAASGEEPDLAHGSIYFIGTATVLLRYAGFTVLTDPNFLHNGDKIHVGYGLQGIRVTNPAIELEDLPPIDLVLLSHMHEDHFDRLVEAKLEKTLPILTTPDASRTLGKKGFSATHPLTTWQSMTVTKGPVTLRVTAMPGQHAPDLLLPLFPPVMGSMLQFLAPSGKTTLYLYITGDTLIHEHLKEIPQRYPEIDLALLHLGGTKLFGVMLTMDGRQGVEAIRLIRPKLSIPIHYNDYNVFRSPLDDFKKAVSEAGLEERVRYLSHGETYEFEVPQSRIV